MDDSTLRPSHNEAGARADGEPVPGLLLVWSGNVAAAATLALPRGGLDLGRNELADDQRVSRRHAHVAFDGRSFTVVDLGSQNGTFADGARVAAAVAVERVVRIGDSLLLPAADIRPLAERGVKRLGGFVRGPAMQALLYEVERASAMNGILHVRGESGSGKEGVAEWFHQRSARAEGPFVPLNCAAIPQNLAERLLFGAKRGAYSGADADAAGYMQEADGGTLFLDEIGELDAGVQVKLLRALEAKEALPLGATKARKVDVQLCSASNKDLRALVAAGTLRDDLYYRIGRPDVTMPPLRNRPEEIPHLVVDQLRKTAPAMSAHVSLIEECLLRPWPGNVRELLVETRAAAGQAAAQGSTRVSAQHLAAAAGRAFAAAPAAAVQATEPARRYSPIVDDDWRRRIEDALEAHGGNVAASARALGLHRNQLRRLIERHGIRVET